VLSEEGKLYDTKKGQSLPDGVGPMPVLEAEALAKIPEPSSMQVVGGYVRRYWDLVALSDKTPTKVIGESGVIRDKPGFDVDFLTRSSAPEAEERFEHAAVLMPVRGHWRLAHFGTEEILAPGDTALVPAGTAHSITPSMSGEASLYRIVGTDDPAGLTWTG
jgi:hypothetical protein